MPYEVKKIRRGKRTLYQVRNKITKRVYARGTSRGKAQAQVRLLRSKEHGY